MTSDAALLVIDMQVGMFDEPRYDADAVIARINALAGKLRAEGAAVIFIQHDGQVGDPFEPDSSGWQLCAELERRGDDPIVRKTTCDAFYATDLDGILVRHGARQLYVTGCATDFCVDTTIRAATSRDYAVTVVADGHTTADRPDLDARSVIRHHNWVWQNLIVAGPAVRVVATAELLEPHRAGRPVDARA